MSAAMEGPNRVVLSDDRILEIRDTSSLAEMTRLGRMLTPHETLLAFARAIIAEVQP